MVNAQILNADFLKIITDLEVPADYNDVISEIIGKCLFCEFATYSFLY